MTEDNEFVPASGTGPPAERELWVGTFPGALQIMVERWFDADGNVRAMTAATRPVPDTHVVWGPPITLERER